MHNIITIGAELWIYENPVLEDIGALENITPESIVDLHIYFNPLLSECHIDPICQYLANPSGIVEIYMNATGCNNPDEIMESCDVIPAVRELYPDGYFTISPNPVESILIISYNLSANSLVSITIHDLSGRLITTLANKNHQQGEQTVIYHTEGLRPGVYFCVLKTNEGKQTMKMIKPE